MECTTELYKKEKERRRGGGGGETNRQNNPDESPENCAEWEKPIPKGYLLYNSIYRAFLKGQRHRMDDRSAAAGLGRQGERQGSACGCRRSAWGLCWWKRAVYQPLHCQATVHEGELWFCKMVPLGKLGKRYTGSLGIISSKCIWSYNYLNIKSLIIKPPISLIFYFQVEWSTKLSNFDISKT